MPQRKTKPKFELPLETERQDAPVGWVYRVNAVPVPAEKHCANSNPLRAAGMGLLLVGAGTIGLVSLATLGLIAAPISLVLRRKRG